MKDSNFKCNLDIAIKINSVVIVLVILFCWHTFGDLSLNDVFILIEALFK